MNLTVTDSSSSHNQHGELSYFFFLRNSREK